MRSFWLGGALLWLGLTAAPARAYEDQLTLGAGVGYGYSASSEWPRHAALFDLSASYGLSREPSRSAATPATAGTRRSRRCTCAILGAELLYLIDVVEVVPYFGIGVSGVGADPRR